LQIAGWGLGIEVDQASRLKHHAGLGMLQNVDNQLDHRSHGAWRMAQPLATGDM
jgi:hypothetical protein